MAAQWKYGLLVVVISIAVIQIHAAPKDLLNEITLDRDQVDAHPMGACHKAGAHCYDSTECCEDDGLMCLRNKCDPGEEF